MKPQVRTMLEEMYSSIYQRHQDSRKSWDYFMEFVGSANCSWLASQLLSRMEWLISDSALTESLMNRYDSELMKSDYHDHLGEMYAEKIISHSEARTKGLYLTHDNVAGLLAEIALDDTEKSLTNFQDCSERESRP